MYCRLNLSLSGMESHFPCKVIFELISEFPPNFVTMAHFFVTVCILGDVKCNGSSVSLRRLSSSEADE